MSQATQWILFLSSTKIKLQLVYYLANNYQILCGLLSLEASL